MPRSLGMAVVSEDAEEQVRFGSDGDSFIFDVEDHHQHRGECVLQ